MSKSDYETKRDEMADNASGSGYEMGDIVFGADWSRRYCYTEDPVIRQLYELVKLRADYHGMFCDCKDDDQVIKCEACRVRKALAAFREEKEKRK